MRSIVIIALIVVHWTPAQAKPMTQPANISGEEKTDKEPETLEKETWKPQGRDKKDWLDCHGLPCEKWDDVERKSTIINILDSVGHATLVKAANELGEGHTPPQIIDEEGPDIILTPEQAEEIFQEAIAQKLQAVGLESKTKSRVKRKIENKMDSRWSLPIRYKFDGEHFQSDRDAIRLALHEWESKTCIRFTELRTSEEFRGEHMIFTNTYGCFSYVGKLDLKGAPQQVNLGPGCLSKPGVPIHEVGHALGLWHEHQRYNRDRFIKIQDNIATWARGNFQVRERVHTEDYDTPYDYNSVMQYSGTVGSMDGNLTIKTLDPLYQKNLGQRVELSYLDAKVINMAYCQDKCEHYPTRYCRNGGYQNPNDCYRCICPDGLTGDFCDETLPSVGGSCSDTIIVEPGKELILTTPGYDGYAYYREGTQCNWLIRVPSGYRVIAKFVEQFGILSMSSKCYHWAEVKTKEDLSYPGYRFCGSRLPDSTFVTDSSKLMLTFRSEIPAHRGAYLRGFKIKLTAVRWQDAYKKQYPVIQKEATTTKAPTTTTIRPTTTTTTTSRPTTTTTTTQKPTTTTKRTTTTTQRPTTTTKRPTTTTKRPTTTTKRPPTTTKRPTTTTKRPTTTTKRPTTTTTRKPNTTTKKPTTTTAATDPYRGMLRLSWSSWSHCQGHNCKCGSHSSRFRLRLCNDEICRGGLYREEEQQCDEVCTAVDVDPIYVGRFYDRPCKPCADGYRNSGRGTCVSIYTIT